MNPQEPTSPAGIPPMSEVPSMNPPAPASPLGVGDMPQDQMKSNLQDLMAKLQAKKQETETSMFDIGKKAKESKSQLFNEIYDFFQKNGVDPSNPEQVKEFLDKLKEANPEVFQQVSDILNQIMADDSEQPDISGAPEDGINSEVAPDNMNMQTNETIPPNF